MSGFWRDFAMRWLREPVLYLAADPASRWRQAEELRVMDDHLLRDIGMLGPEGRSDRPVKPLGPGCWPLSGPPRRRDRTGFGPLAG